MARIEQSVEINASPEAVYERLLHFEEYPSFMQDVRQVRRIGAQRLQWETGHGERARSWQAEITDQEPGRRIAWRHVHGPRYEATIELTPLGAATAAGGGTVAQTQVRLCIECEPYEQVANVQGDAGQVLHARVAQDLARLKKHIEQREPASAQGARVGEMPAGQSEPLDWSASDSRHEEYAGGAPAHERRRMPWKRRPPTLPELWDMWQQPLRMARRVSHDVERVIDTVRGRAAEGTQAAPAGGVAGTWSPAIETARRGRKFVVCAELPGMKSEDVQVEIKYDRLTIAGERRAEPPHEPPHEPHEERHSERRYGRFYRAIALPPGAQPGEAEAAMHDGVLEITVPLAEFANQPRRLAVRPVPGDERNP